MINACVGVFTAFVDATRLDSGLCYVPLSSSLQNQLPRRVWLLPTAPSEGAEKTQIATCTVVDGQPRYSVVLHGRIVDDLREGRLMAICKFKKSAAVSQ